VALPAGFAASTKPDADPPLPPETAGNPLFFLVFALSCHNVFKMDLYQIFRSFKQENWRSKISLTSRFNGFD
jgi:hypothetical protein